MTSSLEDQLKASIHQTFGSSEVEPQLPAADSQQSRNQLSIDDAVCGGGGDVSFYD